MARDICVGVCVFLRRQLVDLPPPIFQDVLDYGVRSRKFPFLERVISHFDLMDIDINATVRLLLKHELMSGFLFVYSFGLMDFAGAIQLTFEHMIGKTFSADDNVFKSDKFPTPEQADIGYKILLFLQYASQGRVFPRGEETVIPSSCLLALTRTLLNVSQLPPIPSSPRQSSGKEALCLVQTKYPYLYALSRVDVYALLFCLQHCFKALYAQNATVISTSSSPVSSEPFGEMILTLLRFTKYGDEMGKLQNSYQRCFYEHFLDLLVSVNTHLPDELILDIIVHCKTHVKPQAAAEKYMFSLVSLQGKYCTSPSLFVSALERFGFYFPALKLYGLKLRCSSETLKNAIQNYVSDRNEEYRVKVFEYIDEFFATMATPVEGSISDGLNEERQTECRNILVIFLEELASIKLILTKKVCMMYLSPSHLGQVIDKTKKQQKLQFELLDALVRGVTSSDGSEESKASDDPALEMSQMSDDLLTPQQMLTYITQLATFRPTDVYPFLTTHNNFPLDETLQVCKAKSIFNATAFLLERAGDSMGAIDLCLSDAKVSGGRVLKGIEELARVQYGDAGKKPNITRRGSRSNSTTAPTPSADIMQILRTVNNHHGSGSGYALSSGVVLEPVSKVDGFKAFNSAIELAIGVCTRHDSKSTSVHWFKVLDYLLREKRK
jgi:hypothetical protein